MNQSLKNSRKGKDKVNGFSKTNKTAIGKTQVKIGRNERGRGEGEERERIQLEISKSGITTNTIKIFHGDDLGEKYGANLKIWRKWPSLWDKTELRCFKSLKQPKAGPSPALPLPVPGVKLCRSLSSTLGR